MLIKRVVINGDVVDLSIFEELVLELLTYLMSIHFILCALNNKCLFNSYYS